MEATARAQTGFEEDPLPAGCLLRAAKDQEWERCIAILACECFSEVNARDGAGLTALHWAALHGRADVCHAIFASGDFVEADAKNYAGRTALECAERFRRADCCFLILARGDMARAESLQQQRQMQDEETQAERVAEMVQEAEARYHARVLTPPRWHVDLQPRCVVASQVKKLESAAAEATKQGEAEAVNTLLREALELQQTALAEEISEVERSRTAHSEEISLCEDAVAVARQEASAAMTDLDMLRMVCRQEAETENHTSVC